MHDSDEPADSRKGERCRYSVIPHIALFCLDGCSVISASDACPHLRGPISPRRSKLQTLLPAVCRASESSYKLKARGLNMSSVGAQGGPLRAR